MFVAAGGTSSKRRSRRGLHDRLSFGDGAPSPPRELDPTAWRSPTDDVPLLRLVRRIQAEFEIDPATSVLDTLGVAEETLGVPNRKAPTKKRTVALWRLAGFCVEAH